MVNSITIEAIAEKILIVRGKKVMLDRDLAKLYGVETSNEDITNCDILEVL